MVRAAVANKKALAFLLKPASTTSSNTGSPTSFHRDTERGIKVYRAKMLLMHWHCGAIRALTSYLDCQNLTEASDKHALVALSKLLNREGRAGAEGTILPYVGHLQLISTLKIGADCCQLCQYKLTKPNLT